MASTINGTSTGSGGLVSTGDDSGILNIQTNETTAVTISAAQLVTFTNPPTALGAGSVATNTAYGTSALAANTSGAFNSALGRRSLISNTSGSDNTATGQDVLYTNTTGSNNTSVGSASLFFNTTGGSNVAVGVSALGSNTTGANNTAVGYQAGYSQVAASNYATYVGSFAGYSTTGTGNTFIGANAGNGQAAGYFVTTGAKNTFIGGYNGNQGNLDLRTNSNNIVLSDGDGNPRLLVDSTGSVMLIPNGGTFNSDPSGASTTGWCYNTAGAVTASRVGNCAFFIGRSSSTGAMVTFRYGGSDVGTISTNGSSTAYNTSSDYRLKNNISPMTGALAKVALLKPVTYKWNADGSNGEGFIAHELAEIVPDCVSGAKDAVDADGKPVYQGIDTSFLVATLTAAIQELKAEFDAYKASHP